MIGCQPKGSFTATSTPGDGPQHRAEIDQRLFDPVDLALLQGGGGGRRVRLHDPFDPLEMRHLAARVEAGRFLPRHVAIKPRITRAGRRKPIRLAGTGTVPIRSFP